MRSRYLSILVSTVMMAAVLLGPSAAAFAFALGLGMVCLPAGPWASLAFSGGSSLLFPINWDAACR